MVKIKDIEKIWWRARATMPYTPSILSLCEAQSRAISQMHLIDCELILPKECNLSLFLIKLKTNAKLIQF